MTSNIRLLNVTLRPPNVRKVPVVDIRYIAFLWTDFIHEVDGTINFTPGGINNLLGSKASYDRGSDLVGIVPGALIELNKKTDYIYIRNDSTGTTVRGNLNFVIAVSNAPFDPALIATPMVTYCTTLTKLVVSEERWKLFNTPIVDSANLHRSPRLIRTEKSLVTGKPKYIIQNSIESNAAFYINTSIFGYDDNRGLEVVPGDSADLNSSTQLFAELPAAWDGSIRVLYDIPNIWEIDGV